MSEREPRITEKQLIGSLILSAEGKPLRRADAPPHIELQGVVQYRIQEILELSEADSLKREHGVVATTNGDRRLHLPKAITCGEQDCLYLGDDNVPLGMKIVFTIHSHPGESTPPSEADIFKLLLGTQGSQAEFVTMLAGDFLLIRTDQTPIITSHQVLSTALEKQIQENKRLLSSNRNHQQAQMQGFIEQLGSTLDPVNMLELYRLSALNDQATHELLLQLMLNLCQKLKVLVYYSPRTGSYQHVSRVEHLQDYIDLYSAHHNPARV
jgi:hypothetical protein